MPTLKKLLLSILILCILASSSAWAFDEHAIDINNINTASGPNLIDSQLDFSDKQLITDNASDHCGHISAHLVGFLSDVTFSSQINHSIAINDYSERFVSFITTPHLRPPSI
tara:strand:- start:230816 stop:231151 length:336 start_codon:yes stop_codon:yes gene_type:complete